MTEKKSEVCKFFTKGTCRYGENCKFHHELSFSQQETLTTQSTGARKIPRVSSSLEENITDTDLLRNKKCRNRSGAKKRRASSEVHSNKRLSIHSPNDIPYLNCVKFISLELRASVLITLYQIKQKSLQLCEAYFDDKIVFDVHDYERADKDGYTEEEMDTDPFFHKFLSPLNKNEQMDWGLMFNEDARLRFKFTTALYRQTSNCCQHLGVRDSVMIPFSVYKSLHPQTSNVVLPDKSNDDTNSDYEDMESDSDEDYDDYCGLPTWDSHDSNEEEPFSDGDYNAQEEEEYDDAEEDFLDY